MLAFALLVQSYHWLEAERFEGVRGHYASWQAEKPAPGWHWNGPGVSAEWGQGGESGFNSISCGDKAAAQKRVQVPHAGRHRLWIRHSESAQGPAPIGLRVGQRHFRVGERPTLDPQDEALAYWGWTFVWEGLDLDLAAGPLTLEISCEGTERRIVDALVLTDDLGWQPSGRERPRFAYLDALARWREGAAKIPPGPRFDPDPKWSPPPLVVPWNFKADSFVEDLPPFAVESQIRKPFLEQFRKTPPPIFSSSLIAPVFVLDELPALLAKNSAARRYLESTHKPFFVLINYQQAPWRKKEEVRREVAEARQSLAAQDRGDISGENIGYPWDAPNPKIVGTRAEVLTAYRKAYEAALTKKASELGARPGSPWPPLIAALSSGSSAFVHALAAWGSRTLGLETAAGMPNFAGRIAFVRGAARQYGREFLYYHAPNFGDTATTFTHTQNLAGPGGWFHSRYGLVFGPSIAWYRKALFEEWFAGAAAIYLEQGFDQFFQPGPGPHPVELNPLGRVTDAFLRYAAEHSERGTPVAPVALLLDRAHGWDDSAYIPRAFNIENEASALQPSAADAAITQTLDVLFYPNAIVQGEPATAERQAFVHAMLGDGVDVLVADANAPIDRYRVMVVLAHEIPPPLQKAISDHAAHGATILAARGSGLCERFPCKNVLAPDGSADPEWATAIATAAWAAAPVHVLGDVEWAVNRTRAGYAVLLMNSRGNDKPQQGLTIAPHREQFADVEIQARGATPQKVRVPAGALRIVDVPISAHE
jgi:hypothetical protein